ncbi:TcdA/TcdB catalytic glycosyltransferase domain-containing protein [Legionella sp. D16C41]|uniref:TcdA/TcdB catalytic glycosyltransferase domain-containing protein n=1 Tax=Legionella sp. D16C41 TaxID=3402688 RepID=UPI003AF74690
MQPGFLPIPNAIHAVWLGKPPSSDVLNNVRDWKVKNPTFDARLWIDSSTYTEDERLNDLPKLLKWAKENKVIICDISLPKEASKDNLVGEQELYLAMPGKQFFDDEISGEYRNLAAASDILRAEILYKYGGIYIDAKDMFPNAPIPQDFKLKFGFAFHDCGQNRLNNDLIASIPKGTIIGEYRQTILNNYKNLYQKSRLLDAHRNNNLRNPNLLVGGDTRYLTTLQTSGPGALSSMIEQLSRFLVLIPEANSPIYDFDESSLFMPNEIFNIPNHGSDVSWNDLTITYEKIKPYLFNYFCEYWSVKIAEEIEGLDKIMGNSNSGLSFLTNYFEKIDPDLYEARKILVGIKNNLDKLPRSLSPDDFFKACLYRLDEKALKVFENVRPDFCDRFQYSFEKFNSRFSLCEKEITDKNFQQALLYVSAKGAFPSWTDFISLFIGLQKFPEDISHLSEAIQEISNKNLPSFRQI